MIIFIDEIDAIGKARDASNNDGGNSERDQTLNQLLTEMDGFDGSNGVIIMAATNRDDVLDPALTRPGRFDRKIYVGNPDALGRKAVLAIHAAKASLHHDININHIVRRTTGFSGAGLMGIIEEAKRLAVRRNDTSVSPEDINEAISKMKVGVARNLALSPEGKRRTAYHESGHSLSKVFAGGAIDNAVTIIPRGESLGHAEPAPEDNDVFLLTKTQLKTRIIQAMGGRAAEELVFGETSTGPENDIEQAEYYARLMVGKLGMSDEVGLLTSAGKDDRFGTRRISEQTAREMDVAVNKILKEGLETAKESLKTHRAELDAMAHALIERETIYKEDIEKIVHRSAP